MPRHLNNLTHLLMRKTLLILGMMYSSHSLVAQQFTANYNADSSLTGFDNPQLKVSLAPQFVQVGGHTFQDVVAVTKEDKEGKWHSYYLFRSMKTAGADSMYMFDNTFDCENEGFIRFTDWKTEKTGVFNRDGKIVVPAAYNYVSKVRNGLIVVLQGAIKNNADSEHWFWEGGQANLIDTTNKLLANDIQDAELLNMYSVKVEDNPSADSTRKSFKGVNGKYYTFQIYKKEFAQWLQRDLVPGLTKEKLVAHAFSKISYWDENEGWVFEDKEKFVDKHWDFLQARLQDVGAFNIVYEDINPFIFEGPQYRQYLDNCFQAKSWQYPSFSIFFEGSNEKGQLDFLRTDEGYQLIGVGFAR